MYMSKEIKKNVIQCKKTKKIKQIHAVANADKICKMT